tara:strand:- start:148 stop:573 length:426 start_codon:yes stop_codon:yes gene_type:complete
MEYRKFYFIVLVMIVLMVVHVEIVLNKDVAPELVLIQVLDPIGNPEEGASCRADIVSDLGEVEDKSLRNLDSIYDVMDSKLFSASETRGFYVLETELERYSGKYGINIVCISPGNLGVSYTVLNESSQNCEIKEGGKLVVC